MQYKTIKTLFTITFLFFTFNALSSDYYFQSGGKEVQVNFTGSIYDPESIRFNGSCPPSYCDKNAFTRQLVLDFFDAVVNDRVYKYEQSFGPVCPPFDPCNIVDGQLPIYETDSNESDSFGGLIVDDELNHIQGRVSFITQVLRAVVIGSATKIGEMTAEELVELAFGENSADNGLKDIVFAVIIENGRPSEICIETEDGCIRVDDVYFSEVGNQIVVHENFDVNNQFDRIVQNQINSFMLKLFSRCRLVQTGPVGDTTVQLSCW